MTDAPLQPAVDSPAHQGRVIVLVLLIAAGLAFACFWYFTATGQDWRERHVIQQWMIAHPVLAPLALIAMYILMTVLAMPVWWLQAAAGHTLGLIEGIIVCEIAATISAGVAAKLAHWTAGDFFAARFESKMARLRKLEEKVDHNGFLVVVLTRLLHVMPFGISNYLFGLLHISTRSILIGTAIGNLPAIALYVALGTPHPFQNKGLMVAIVTMNLIALLILPIRYLRPQWFRKIGIE